MTDTDEQRNEEHHGEQETGGDINLASKIWSIVFKGKAAAWTACFTAILAIFSWLLFQANNDANKTAIATQRAFVTFTQIYFEPVPRATSPDNVFSYRAHMPMINNGTTATKYSTYEMAVAVEDSIPQEGTDFDVLQQSEKYPFVFGPKQLYDGLGTPVSVADFEAVAQEKKHMFFWGWVVYRDVFEGTPVRLSEFCFNITNPRWQRPNHNDETNPMKATTLPCKTHNCYDENCSDYNKRIEGFK